MGNDFYDRFNAMRDAIHDGPPDAAAAARAFYQSIVGVDAIVRLTVALRLPVTDGGQDWAIEIADADLLVEYLDAYDARGLADDERHWLLELIVASLDERLRAQGPDPRLEARVRDHLAARFAEHRDSIGYWACLDEPGSPRFAVAPLMRSLLASAGDDAPGAPGAPGGVADR